MSGRRILIASIVAILTVGGLGVPGARADSLHPLDTETFANGLWAAYRVHVPDGGGYIGARTDYTGTDGVPLDYEWVSPWGSGGEGGAGFTPAGWSDRSAHIGPTGVSATNVSVPDPSGQPTSMLYLSAGDYTAVHVIGIDGTSVRPSVFTFMGSAGVTVLSSRSGTAVVFDHAWDFDPNAVVVHGPQLDIERVSGTIGMTTQHSLYGVFEYTAWPGTPADPQLDLHWQGPNSTHDAGATRYSFGGSVTPGTYQFSLTEHRTDIGTQGNTRVNLLLADVQEP